MQHVIFISILLGCLSLGAQALCLNFLNTTLQILNGNQINSSVLMSNTTTRPELIATTLGTETTTQKLAELKKEEENATTVSPKMDRNVNLSTLSILYENQINSTVKVPTTKKPESKPSTPATTKGPTTKQNETQTESEEVKKEFAIEHSIAMLPKTELRSSFTKSDDEETTFDHKSNQTEVTFDYKCNVTDPRITDRLSPTLLKVLTRLG